MARVGFDANTGGLLFGWDHCKQSIRKILTTEFGSRVQRRKFGSELPRLIDIPQTSENVIRIYVAIAQALEPRIVEGRQYGEPGFVLLRANVNAATPGEVQFNLSGVYFENGHLGDFSRPVEKSVSFMASDLSDA